MNKNLFPSQACSNVVKKFEGLHKLTPEGDVAAYKCPAGKWTIGYGHTKGVKSTMRISKDEAEGLLRDDLTEHGNHVKRLVKVSLTQAQFDALTSFVFNLGPGAFGGSTLLKKLNEGDYDGAAGEFSKWNKARENGVLKVFSGLTRRRAAEAALFTMDAEIETIPQPQKPQQEALKPLTQSKTMVGATAAGAGTVLAEISTSLEPVVGYSEVLKIVFLALTLAGISLVAYARWKDHKEGIK
jgi:lysozyme